MRKLLFIIATIMAFTTCCKDEKPCMDPTNPNCENYDPCFGKERPSAKFIMEESNVDLTNQGIWLNDSVFWGSKVRFRSEITDPNVKHTWYVGSEIFTSSTTPDRDFKSVSRPNTITISHVIEYKSDLICFPDDTGRDSVTQTFRLINSRNDEFLTYGTFRGILTGGLDSFDISIAGLDKFNQPANYLTYEKDVFINFHNRGDTLETYALNGAWPPHRIEGYFYNYNGFFTRPLIGTFVVNQNGTFEMTYKNDSGWEDLLGDRNWHTFKGRKIE